MLPGRALMAVACFQQSKLQGGRNVCCWTPAFLRERESSPSTEEGDQSVTKQLISPAHSLLAFGGGQGASRVTGAATALLPLSFRDWPDGEHGAGGTDRGHSPRHPRPVLLGLSSPPKYMYKGLLWICTHPKGTHAACKGICGAPAPRAHAQN